MARTKKKQTQTQTKTPKPRKSKNQKKKEDDDSPTPIVNVQPPTHEPFPQRLLSSSGNVPHPAGVR
jgi:hypothetical protein